MPSHRLLQVFVLPAPVRPDCAYNSLVLIMIRPAMTAIKLSALNRNSEVTPLKAMTSPAMPGPRIRARLKIEEFSATARSEERRVGKECRSRCDWSSDVCSSDLEQKQRGDATEGNDQPGDARTKDTCQIKDRRVQRDSIGKILAPNHFNTKSLARWHIKAIRCTKQQSQDIDLPDLNVAARYQPPEDSSLNHCSRLGKKQNVSFWPAVGKHSPEYREE